jgi:hypothetical protein
MLADLYHVSASSTAVVGLTLPCGTMPAKPSLPPGCVEDAKIVHSGLPTLEDPLPLVDGKLELV